MADKLVTVRPSGGTYTSLAAAITGELSANADLETMQGILTIQIEGDWTSLPDTDVALVNGFTQNENYYVNILINQDNRSSTSRSSVKYRLETSSYSLWIVDDYTRVTGMQIKGNSTAGSIRLAGSHCVIDSCLIYDSGSISIGFANGSHDNVIVNTLIMGSAGECIAGQAGAGNRNYLKNVTAQGVYGIYAYSGIINAINSYSMKGANEAAWSIQAGTFELTDCFSSDESQSTTLAPYSTSTFESVTVGAENFSLPSGSALIDSGTDLSTDATFPFDWDILGNARGTLWDVGAFEVQGGASVELAGTITASSTVEGLLLTPKYLSGTIHAQSAVSGAIEVSKPLSGVITAQSTASGNIEAIKYLVGTVSAVSNATGDLRTTSGLSGIVLGESSASGSLFVSKYLSGIGQAQFLITGNIQVNKYLSAILTTQSTASGTLSGSVDKPGIAHITFVSKTNMMTLSGKSNMIGKQNANSLTGKANNITMGVGDD